MLHVTTGTVLTRPSYGVVFSTIDYIHNSGSFWNHLYALPILGRSLLPPRATDDIYKQLICDEFVYADGIKEHPDTMHENTNSLVCTHLRDSLKSYVTRRNSLIDSIETNLDSVQLLTSGTLNKDSSNSDSHKRKKRGLFQDVTSGILSHLFGMAKSKDMKAVKNHVAKLTEYTQSNFENIHLYHDTLQSVLNVQQHEIQNASININLTMNKLNSMIDWVSQVQQEVTNSENQSINRDHKLHITIRLLSQNSAALDKAILDQIASLEHLDHEINNYLQGLQTLSEGHLSLQLVKPQQLRVLVDKINTKLQHSPDTSEFYINIKSLDQFYGLTVQVFKHENNLLIRLNFPLASRDSSFKILKIRSLKVPLDQNETGPYRFTKLENLSPFLAVSSSEQYHMNLDIYDLMTCQGHSQLRICDPMLMATSKEILTCEFALYLDIPAEIDRLCQVSYIEQKVNPAEMISLGGRRVLLSSTKERYVMTCPRAEPTLIPICSFCVFTLPCGCDLRSKSNLIQRIMSNCSENSSQEEVQYPINLAATREVYKDIRAEQIQNLTGSSTFPTLPRITYPEYSIERLDTSQVASQSAHIINFKKINKLRSQNQKIYQSSAELISAPKNIAEYVMQSTFGGPLLILISCMTLMSFLMSFFAVVKTCPRLAQFLGLASTVKAKSLVLTRSPPPVTIQEDVLEYSMFKPVVTIILIGVCLFVLTKIAKLFYDRWTVRRYGPSLRDSPAAPLTNHVYMSISSHVTESCLYITSVQATTSDVKFCPKGNIQAVGIESKWCGLIQSLKLCWDQSQLIIGEQAIQAPLNNEVFIPFFQRNTIRNLLVSAHKIQLLVGRGNYFVPLTIVPSDALARIRGHKGKTMPKTARSNESYVYDSSDVE